MKGQLRQALSTHAQQQAAHLGYLAKQRRAVLDAALVDDAAAARMALAAAWVEFRAELWCAVARLAHAQVMDP